MPLKVLTALDHAKTQYYHFTAIMIAGMGLFTDAYDLFSITPVLKLIGRVYYPSVNGKPGVIHPSIISVVVSITLLGTVVGQLVFGALGDRIGRKKVYGFSLLIMVSSSVASGFSVCRTRKCVLTSLCFFRFWLGLGIGGDYPLSATIISEFANKRTRGALIAAVFSMQGFGILASSATTMVLAVLFLKATDKAVGTSPLHTPEAADILWRVILMIGAVPAGLTIYWRMSMPETARYTALVENDVNKANKDIARVLQDHDLNMTPDVFATLETYNQSRTTYGIFSKPFLKRHGRNLFACSMAWLIVDIPFYSSTLFQSKIYQPWFKPAEEVNAYEEVYNVAKFQAIIAIASTIPGYFATVFSIDRIGRRKIQMMGFFFMGIFLFVLGGPYNNHWYDHRWFMILYGLTFFFSNFGPNTTTFIVPAELFPARFRTTCHGISGAAGKVGAIVGSVGFLWTSQDRKKPDEGYEKGIGMMYSLIMLGGVCILGVLLTYFFTPETMGKSLEENEDVKEQDDNEEAQTN